MLNVMPGNKVKLMTLNKKSKSIQTKKPDFDIAVASPGNHCYSLIFLVSGMFLNPLPRTDALNMSGNLTPNFQVSTDNFVNHLDTEEQEKLADDDETDENWLNTASPSPVARKKRKTVNFVQSPKFLSPRRSFSTSVFDNVMNRSVEDGSTPKEVIRDKFRRVSMALSTREMELERERSVRLEVETELQELQEFTR